jgi:4-oxalocrotonate tautomerase
VNDAKTMMLRVRAAAPLERVWQALTSADQLEVWRASKSDTLARMPEVIIEIAQGRTQDQKRALIKEITEAVVRTCSVPADAVTVIIHENPLTDKGKGGVLFSER